MAVCLPAKYWLLLEKVLETHCVLLQVGGISQEADYEYLGQDGFCHDRKHGGSANAQLTRLKVSSKYIKIHGPGVLALDGSLVFKLRLPSAPYSSASIF